jgi:exodeoxyribonuclease III
VNGIRAVMKKGFLEFAEREDPDILCLQETKIHEKQLTQEMMNLHGYYSTWAFAERAGYSGVVVYSKVKPKSVQVELGGGVHDDEGRLVLAEFEDFTLVNVYIPNGGRGDHRIEYKLNYYDEMLDLLEKRRAAGENLVICGDFNTAHTEIDLARPRANVNVTGFLPVERAWLDKFVGAGYVDTFRHLNPETTGAYSWWSYRSAARKRNVGWRIDYFYVNEEFMDKVKNSEIMAEVEGSDHCPLELNLF